MKRIIPVIASAAILALSATSVVAKPDHNPSKPDRPSWSGGPKNRTDLPPGLDKKKNPVPEINAAAGGSAIVLLSGLLLLLSERRRSGKKSVTLQNNQMV